MESGRPVRDYKVKTEKSKRREGCLMFEIGLGEDA